MEDRVSGVVAFLEWQERLNRFEMSGLLIDALCRQEDVGRSEFSQWLLALKENSLGEANAETRAAEGPTFVLVTVKTQFIEILFWHRDGLCIYYKRLEVGNFPVLTAASDSEGIEIENTDCLTVDWRVHAAYSERLHDRPYPEPATDRFGRSGPGSEIPESRAA